MMRRNKEGYQREYQAFYQGGYQNRESGYADSYQSVHQNRRPDPGYGASGRYPGRHGNENYGYPGGYGDEDYVRQGGYGDGGYVRPGGYSDVRTGYPGVPPARYPDAEYRYPEPHSERVEDTRYDMRADMYDGYDEDYGESGTDNAGEVNAFSAAGILKFAAAFLILVYIVLLLIYASGSTKPFEEVAQAVEGRIDTEILVKQDAQALKRYYGLNGADYEGVLFYSAEFSISAEEVLLIEVRSEQQVQEVRDAIEERLESRKHTFEGYAPEQAQLIDQAQLQVRGRYVFLAVSAEAENYVSAFTNGL